MNMYIWPISVLNQLFIQVSYTQLKLKKKKKELVVSGKNPFFVMGPFRTSHSVCLNTGFWQGSFVGNVALSFVVAALN